MVYINPTFIKPVNQFVTHFPFMGKKPPSGARLPVGYDVAVSEASCIFNPIIIVYINPTL